MKGAGHILWKFGSIEIVRSGDDLFGLFFQGRPVMSPGNFRNICRYVWAEFLD